jgi:hypothetical protein
MNKIITFLIVSIAIVNFSCNKKEDKTLCKLSEEYKIGDFGDYLNEEFLYNDNNQLIRINGHLNEYRDIVYKNNKVDEIYSYTYSDFYVKYKYYWNNNKLDSITTSQVLVDTVYLVGTDILFYTDNRIDSIYNRLRDGFTYLKMYFYWDGGNILREINTINGNIVEEYTYEYDNKNNMYESVAQSIIYDYRIMFFNRNNVIKKNYYKHDENETIDTYEYFYEYNEYDYPIKKTFINESGEEYIYRYTYIDCQ